MPLYEKTHVGHEKHLCNLVGMGVTLEEYKKLVKNAAFVCRLCGRVASKAENLCDPVNL